MPKPQGPSPRDCPQCWQHANDRSIHRALGPGEDCKPCLDHANKRCPDKR